MATHSRDPANDRAGRRPLATFRRERMDNRPVLALGSPAYAIPEFEDLCKRYTIRTISRDGLNGHSDVAEAIAREVSARAATGGPPYIAFIWFFDVWSFLPFDEQMLRPLTDNGCRFFSGGGAGYDGVHTEWMASQGAYYCNTPTAFTVSTANGALMLILAATRAISQGDMYTKAGKWRGDPSVPGDLLPIVPDVEGLKLGIIGLGSIGQALSVRARACGMEVVYHNRRPVPDSGQAAQAPASILHFEFNVSQRQLARLSCPLTPATRHLLGPAEFAKMKTGVFAVNTSRGPVIDEEALVEALKSDKVSRAAINVFEREPVVHSGLLDPSLAHRVTLQPHTTGRTCNAFAMGERQIFKSLEEYMRGETPEYAVNNPKMRAVQ